MVFIDIKKAYDMVSRDLIWQALNKRNVPRGYFEIIEEMYEEKVTSV